MKLRFDLHIHTWYSKDAISKPEIIIKTAIEKGLDGIGVVDHNSLRGGLKTHAISPDRLLVIPGEEVKTDLGDIIGFFIKEEIKSKNAFDVIDEIRSQGGIVVLPHPFKKHRNIQSLAEAVDLIEGFNGRATPLQNKRAFKLANSIGIPMVAGSDAHFPWEIGRAYVEFNVSGKPDMKNIEEISSILLSEPRKVFGSPRILVYEVISQAIKHLRGGF